ncbi:hypothetical protein JMJ35_009718 [Cladonia borealis]|uniref:Uncharacterized protein n=1 Tax=Cladonia borealis TaxID=184061 RepID=A0AA39QTW0_9LECA|nr:hypothetical protein JMJ35_009718 [Cladonia borealis]
MVNLRERAEQGRHHHRRPTVPFARTTRQKPRRWPLALRFIKGAIHSVIILPVTLHGLFAALIVFLDLHLDGSLSLPTSIIPSLSIVVGLMLVFRNQTSYNRFWDGRNYLTVIITSVRNLTRSFLACSAAQSHAPTTNNPTSSPPPSPPTNTTFNTDRLETERVINILVAILYATKNHLRSAWGAEIIPGTHISPKGTATPFPEYSQLFPQGFTGLDDRGVGLPLQLTFFVEAYIKHFFDKGYFHGPQASQMTVQLNTLTDAYGRMETIRLTSIPIAHLIHQKQVLCLFGCVLPFALVSSMKWFTIPIVVLVTFTLYGIDGIAMQLEDPFGFDKNDIRMDAIVEDVRTEIMVLLEEWKRYDSFGSSLPSHPLKSDMSYHKSTLEAPHILFPTPNPSPKIQRIEYWY